MVRYVGHDSNIYIGEILFQISVWYSEYLMYDPSTLHIRESYSLKSKNQYPDTPIYMEVLIGEHADEYYKAVNDEVQSLIRRYIWEAV